MLGAIYAYIVKSKQLIFDEKVSNFSSDWKLIVLILSSTKGCTYDALGALSSFKVLKRNVSVKGSSLYSSLSVEIGQTESAAT